MLDIQFIINNREIIEKTIEYKSSEPVDIDELVKLYNERKELVSIVDNLNREKNEVASAQDREKGSIVKEKLKENEAKLRDVSDRFLLLLAKVPNVISADTPIGKDDKDNKVIKKVGDIPTFSFEPKAHWDLGAKLGVIDSERASKTVGSRFTYLKGDLVKVQFALTQFAIDVSTNEEILKEIVSKNNLSVSSKPFIPVIPPAMVNPNTLFEMARIDPKEDKFFLEKDNLFLSGSAEHLLGSMHKGEVLENLPKRYIGYSSSFRREAGSYGKDTKGILRQHQFDKLEFESFSSPEQSIQEQDFLVAIQEYLLDKLKLPYQVVAVCSGDMGKPDYRQIDIETYMPGQGVYRETHSSDYMASYQSRRLNTKMNNGDKKEFVHTNDATVFAIGRMLIAIMENYQLEDGSIEVPSVLHNYTNITKIGAIQE